MYTLADDENKKAAGGLLFSVALTAFLTGITEPIEFTFLFYLQRFTTRSTCHWLVYRSC
ncbi:PTS transporter subunit EIIC [Vibrio sp. M60_M31a]